MDKELFDQLLKDYQDDLASLEEIKDDSVDSIFKSSVVLSKRKSLGPARKRPGCQR